MAYRFTSSATMHVNSAVITALPVSMFCWANPANLTSAHQLMWLGDKDDTNRFLGMNLKGDAGGDPLRCRHSSYGASSSTWDSSAAYNVNAWNACGVRFTSTTSRDSYLNGSKASNTSTVGAVSNHDRTAIGWWADSTPTYAGDVEIAWAAMWNVALTDDEFDELCKGEYPGKIRPENVFMWDLLGDAKCETDSTFDMSVSGGSTTDSPSIYLPAQVQVGLGTAGGGTILPHMMQLAG